MYHYNIYKLLYGKQDTLQYIKVMYHIIYEIYRVISCSLLLFFVPNTEINNIFYIITKYVNYITLGFFILFYFIEIKRELKLIKYLDINREIPINNISIIDNLELSIKNKIFYINNIYINSSKIISLIYFTNLLISGLIIFKYSYLDNSTTTTFITYFAFIAEKLYTVYFVTNTDLHIFYSSYLHMNLQFNDIDSHLKDIELNTV